MSISDLTRCHARMTATIKESLEECFYTSYQLPGPHDIVIFVSPSRHPDRSLLPLAHTRAISCSTPFFDYSQYETEHKDEGSISSDFRSLCHRIRTLNGLGGRIACNGLGCTDEKENELLVCVLPNSELFTGEKE
ncbi:rho gtpase-activating protein 39 isoform 2 [Moniliophthora roreri]|nr:rho gtpase-activating protein 39 isoform 2 [Moniliophthora roreri]